MTLAADIRAQLAKGPKTSAQLAVACGATPARIKNSIVSLKVRGCIMRFDDGTGPGSLALWGLDPTYQRAPDYFWTPERIDIATKLYLDGLSAGQIALRLGAKGRNSVIGIMHRKGVASPSRANSGAEGARLQTRINLGSVSFKPRPKPNPKTAKAPHLLPPRPIPRAPLVAVQCDPCVLVDLGPRMCRWPLTAPPQGFGELTLFCAAHAAEGPYCPSHSRIAFTAPQAKFVPPSADRRRFNHRQFPGSAPTRRMAE